ncbi:MAG: tryptophan synthase subunit alpha, partial [Solirubrobacteraceae bacterium]
TAAAATAPAAPTPTDDGPATAPAATAPAATAPAATAPAATAPAGVTAGEQRLARAFAAGGRRTALMPYLMAGYPSVRQSLAIGHACVDAGADVIELGVPYSDPLADGPVIHAAGTAALAAGTSLTSVLDVARELSDRVPVVLMCYSNMVLAPGADAFAQRLALTGASGLIVPDLPFEESVEVRAACVRHGLALVPLLAPSSTDERIAAIGAEAMGFVYLVSVLGTTGERAGSAEGLGQLRQLIARAKASTRVPVAIGFGIGTPQRAREVARLGADGVIVGSRLVRAAGESEIPEQAVGALVAELAAALATNV